MPRKIWTEELREAHRQYVRNHYENNKEQYLLKNQRRRKEYRDRINEIKSVPCIDCGIQYPSYVMDFDHRDGEIKSGVIARMVNQCSPKVFDEIQKCDLVCSNCHRERTHQRKLKR